MCCEFEFFSCDVIELAMSKTIIDVNHFEFRWSRIARYCCTVIGKVNAFNVPTNSIGILHTSGCIVSVVRTILTCFK